MINRVRILILFPCALILVLVTGRWLLTRGDPLRGLAPYTVSNHTSHRRMTSMRGVVRYVSERQVEINGISLAEIKKLLDRGRPLKGGYAWQDMYGTSKGKKIWIGCGVPGTAPLFDSISIFPDPQDGTPTLKYVVEIDHPMTPAEVKAHGLMTFSGKP